MNYNWNWGVLLQPTGVGGELYWHWLLKGFGWLLVIGLAAWIIALILGSVLGVMKTLPNKTARTIATLWVGLFRNVPLLVQLFFWFYVAPTLLTQSLREWWFTSLSFNTTALISATIGLGLFTSARIVEQVRTGIESLPKGNQCRLCTWVYYRSGLSLCATTPSLSGNPTAHVIGADQLL